MVLPSKRRGKTHEHYIYNPLHFGLILVIWSPLTLVEMFLVAQYAGSAWDELKHIRQAVGFLVSLFLLNSYIFC